MWLKQILFISICFPLLSGSALAQSAEESDKKVDEQQGLHADGGTWNFFQAKKSKDATYYILLIGDSVMNGYHQDVIDSLKKIATVDYWVTGMHLNSQPLLTELVKKVTSRNYDVIHFNIGLHGWQEGRIPEGRYVSLLNKYVRTIQENAPGATLIWASTTPVTERDRPQLNKEINPVIVERNQLATEVMNQNGVPINDLYGLLEDKLYLARLDRFHWEKEGYRVMADQCLSFILNELNKDK